MQKILITGGCGYIGSHTIADLIQNDYEVLCIDNLYNSDEKVLDQVESITGKRVKNHKIDIRDLDTLRNLFDEEKIKGIIHFAALKAVGESVEIPLEYYENNVQGMLNLLKCQKEFGVKHHIFSSSCSVYGLADKLPVTEQTPIQEAESPYGRTKQINEYMIKDFAIANPEYHFTILRYFNPAGAHHSGKMGESPINPPLNIVPVITETAIGKREKVVVFGTDYETRDGSCVRDFIHIEDLAHAHTLALTKVLERTTNSSNVEIYNLGTGNGVSVLETIKAFEESTGVKLNYELGPRRIGDVVEIYANNDKAINDLGWKAKYDIHQIMKSAWDWEITRSRT